MLRRGTKVLNLTENFDPMQASLDESLMIKYKAFTFHGGEPHIVIDPPSAKPLPEFTIVTARINEFNDLGKIVVAVDALRSLGHEDIFLLIPYFPAARQDRRMVEGEPLTVKVYADIINSLNLKGVSILDAHSDVAPALINNSRNLDNYGLVTKALQDILGENKSFNLIVPDAGAGKKAMKLAKVLQTQGYKPQVVRCDKQRDVATGKLTGFKVYDFINTHLPSIIVDDICDGGGTFIGLAEELRKLGANDLYLVVSHGIFSHGFKELRKHFFGIYCSDSICSDYSMEQPTKEKGSEIVKVIPMKDFLVI